MKFSLKSKSELYDSQIAMIAVLGAAINSIFQTIVQTYINIGYRFDLYYTFGTVLGRLLGDSILFIFIFICTFFSLKLITTKKL